jgi:DHA1 family tetracycline resistance protein-like MFS transporter
MISAPIIGRLSDAYGRRPMLLLCILGTIVSFYLLGRATSVFEPFFSRILDGILGGNISLAQAYISDVTTNTERSRGLGFVGAAFGIGFIVGPALGGGLSNYGYRLPAYAACAISLVNFLGVIFFLPESLPKEKRKIAHSDDHSLFSSAFFKSVQIPVLRSFLLLRFLYGFTFTLFETCFGFFNLQRLGLSARHSSYLLCYVGLVFSMVQGGGLKAFLKRFSEGKLILVSSFVLSLSLLWWSGSVTHGEIMLSLFPLSLASGLLNTLINSEITKQVEQSELGGTLGLSAAIGSLTRVLAPMSSGYFIDKYGVSSPGVIGCGIMTLMTAFIYHNRLHLVSSKVTNTTQESSQPAVKKND